MKYVIAGGSGFLGTPLTRELMSKGHEVVVLTRGRAKSEGGVRQVTWTGAPSATDRDWEREIDGADGVINLAGAGIADRRWSAARKQELQKSRTDSTRALVEAIGRAARRPSVLVSGSALGYYGPQPHDGPALDESAPAGSDFLSTLAVEWEQDALRATVLGCRVVLVRTGVVLARDGGALKKLIPPFQMFVGGPLGSGRQVVSWIHRADWVDLVVWLLRHDDASGPYNATAPQPVTNGEFSGALAEALHRPSWLPVPGFALKAIVGEMAGPALLSGQRVIPARAIDQGFTFRYPDIRSAMRAAV